MCWTLWRHDLKFYKDAIAPEIMVAKEDIKVWKAVTSSCVRGKFYSQYNYGGGATYKHGVLMPLQEIKISRTQHGSSFANREKAVGFSVGKGYHSIGECTRRVADFDLNFRTPRRFIIPKGTKYYSYRKDNVTNYVSERIIMK